MRTHLKSLYSIIIMITVIWIVKSGADYSYESDSMITFHKVSGGKKPSLRQRFELMPNNERLKITNNITHILMPHNLEQQYQHLNRRTVCSLYLNCEAYILFYFLLDLILGMILAYDVSSFECYTIFTSTKTSTH